MRTAQLHSVGLRWLLTHTTASTLIQIVTTCRVEKYRHNRIRHLVQNIKRKRNAKAIILLSLSWQNQQNDSSAQRRLKSAWASAQSDQSSLSAWSKLHSLATHCAHNETLIRLGECLGWSESSLGAKVILLVLSWIGSYMSLVMRKSVFEQQRRRSAQSNQRLCYSLPR